MSRIANRDAVRAQELHRSQRPQMLHESGEAKGTPQATGLTSADGVEAMPSARAPQLTPAASQTLRAAVAAGESPFAHLVAQLGSAPGAAPLPQLAAILGLEADASPSVELMEAMAEVELATTALGEGKEGQVAKLLRATDKVRQGMMLNLSDAVGAYTGKGSGVPRDVAQYCAENLADKHLNIAKEISTNAAKLESSIQAMVSAQKGHFPAGMDINAFVQAVLRESYLLQNESLKDFADKVKYYNDLKKKMRARLSFARQLNLEDGAGLTEPLIMWDIDEEEWVYYSLPGLTEEEGPGDPTTVENEEDPDSEPTVEKDPVVVVGREDVMGQTVSVLEGSFRKHDEPERGSSTYVGETGSFAGLLDSGRPMFGDFVLFDNATATEVSKVAGYISSAFPQLSSVVRTQLVRGLIEHVTEHSPQAADAMLILREIIAVATPAEIKAIWNDLSPTERTTLGVIAPEAKILKEKYDSEFDALYEQGIASDPALREVAELCASYAALPPGDDRREYLRDRLLAKMWSLSGESANKFLKAIAGHKEYGKLADDLFFACDPAKLTAGDGFVLEDWEFLTSLGGTAADFFDEQVSAAIDSAQVEADKQALSTAQAQLDSENMETETHTTEAESDMGGGDPGTVPDGAGNSPIDNANLLEGMPRWKHPDGTPRGEPPADPVYTEDGIEGYINSMEEALNTMGDDAQLANVDLQSALQKQQQTLQMMSNISKMLHDTAMSIIRKIGS